MTLYAITYYWNRRRHVYGATPGTIGDVYGSKASVTKVLNELKERPDLFKRPRIIKVKLKGR